MKQIFEQFTFSRLARAVAIAAQIAVPFVAGAALNINTPEDINKQILCPIAAYMFWILIALSTVMVLYAAFMYLSSQGDAEKVGKATKTITYAAVAIVVALLAKGFPALISSIVGGPSVSGCA
ncbi:MAG: hypothetical protein A2945_01850 [Candidatus Liptonbacteria bacterium RIFCSPLOWO2_01_FULL_52_25]|uniref:Uncharacterized protein n=1 Tax=Candidatus Liptonbacteria bacterium RIFCSPLOWO2_01_FULL_52_25 TaxID=1798650 RepID=A0A1G2CEA1_9BACT|nr:MAG: hypothetical protein A2945_01850 [Candidatus Liptonbacteria bacterium RIFCSPLOWO2_01_FULL_52_25]